MRKLSNVVVVAFCLSWISCATTQLHHDDVDVKTLPSAPLRSVDWTAKGSAAFDDLVAYLRIDTVNPPGNEKNGALFLQELLQKHEIESEVLDLPGAGENRASLIARVKSTVPATSGPLCLVSHIDVVTAEASRWPKDRGPGSGAVVDEEGQTFVYGRGALDMKGMAMMELHALFALIESKIERHRDVVVVAVADEEVKSRGMEHMISDEVWSKIGCTHAINEGGLGLKDAIVEGQTVFAISVGERGVLWSKIVAEGPPGHGSTPIPGRAPERLLAAMKRLDVWRDKPMIHPAMYELLAEVGNEAGGAQGFVLQRPFLVDMFVSDRLQQKPTTRAITTNTVHLTGFGGAEQPNVVPSTVWAQYDVRLLPGTTPAAMKATLEKILEGIEGLHIEVLEEKEAGVSEWNDPLFRALQRNAVDGVPRAIAGPIISPGFTDSILLRRRGVKAYGIIPVVIDAKDSSTMHGDGERVSKENIARGTRTLALTLADVVGSP
ncbi:MAG: M20/M25/M40 family metallo-hydrolase [Deltaproteobacteria bacterium]|nr:M20/M25/M40 family metallo-hydrolase [Deltaproteobacteria bacterium]